MAGHRMKSGGPTVKQRRVSAKRQLLWSRLETTTDPSARVGVAAGYVRSVLKSLNREHAVLLADTAVSRLVDTTEEWLSVHQKGARR